MLFSAGACEQHGAINSRTESQNTSSISKPAVKGVRSLAFSRSRSTQRGRRVNSSSATQSSSWFGKGGEGERCEVLPYSAGTTALPFWKQSCSLSPARVRRPTTPETRMKTLMVVSARGDSNNLTHMKRHFFFFFFKPLFSCISKYLHDLACLDVQDV